MIVDNQSAQVSEDNAQTQTQDTGQAAAQTNQTFSWKANLGPDIANSPTMQKFPDTKEGLVESAKSYLQLEKLLGHEKVPVPKSKDDVEGWAIFSKAFGIPDNPQGYGLEDPKLPESLKALTFDREKFAEIAHQNKLTPDQTKSLFKTYTEMTSQVYAKTLEDRQKNMTTIINQLKGEWGDAYQSKVDLGQMAINKLSDGKEMNDWLTASLLSHPYGIKWAAKVGDQFAENKIGDFKYQRFSVTPDEAQKEIDTIRRDPNHPYNNDRATPAERDRAIDHVNDLLTVISKAKSRG